MLKIDMEPIRGVLCVRLSGSLHKGNISKLDKEVISLLKKAKVKNIVLNIKDLDYVDYYGKKKIINSFQVCHVNKGNMFLCLEEKQKKLFEGFKFLNVIKDELAAVELINL